MKCRLLTELSCDPCDDHPDGIMPAGTVIDHPDAYRLVLHGCAEPADDECRTKAPVTPEQAAKRLDSYMKIAKGIVPEDREAWDLGYMRGYYPDGTWIPGPNASEYEQLQEEEERRNSPLYLPDGY